MKFIHSADIHLDSPFALLPPDRAAVRRNEIRAAFTSMLLYARLNACDMVILSGDIIESAYATRDTANLLIREFEAMPKVKIIIAPGNHDPYEKGSLWSSQSFPDNVFIFDSDKLSYFSFDDLNTDVYGFAFTSNTLESNPFAGMSPLNPDRVNIIAAHGDLTSPISKKCPITKAEIEATGCNYVALGHIHNTTGIAVAGKTHYGYSGCLEGRDFGECGHKGAIVVEIDDDKRVTTRGIRFSKKRYEILTLDVTGSTSVEDAREKFRTAYAKSGFSADTILRLVLEGSVAPEFSAAMSDFSENIVEFVDNTSPTYDADYLQNDPGIRGAFYRELLPLLQSDDVAKRRVAAEALRLGLREIQG